MEALLSLIMIYSSINNLDSKLVTAIIVVESNFKSNSISSTQDYGLMQLHKSSFPGYSETDLLDPETNIRLGTAYLSKMKNECKHKEGNDWLSCYNLGIYKAKALKYPRLFPYVKKVNEQLAKLASMEYSE